MLLSSIIMTRVIGIASRGELNPLGKVFLPKLIPEIVRRYNFQKYPTSLQEYSSKEGTVFELGYADECGTINKLTAYNDGLTIETMDHSENARLAIQGIYEWLAKDHGLKYGPRTVKRWLYVTDLSFYSDADLTMLNPVLQPICEAMTKYNETLGRKSVEFKAARVAVDYDHSIQEFPQTPFLIERDKGAKFSENKYFSESPFPSEQHIKILEDVERGLLGQ